MIVKIMGAPFSPNFAMYLSFRHSNNGCLATLRAKSQPILLDKTSDAHNKSRH